MTLPDLPPGAPRPSEWARRVSRFDPHGLDVLEAHALAYSTGAEELAHTSKWLIAWNVATVFLSVGASIGGFAAVFGNPRDISIGRMEEPDSGAIPYASVFYAIAALGVVLVCIRWFMEGRQRDRGLQVMLGWTFLFGVIGVPVSYGLAQADGVGLGLLLLPDYVMMVLAVIVFVFIQLSPPMEPEPVKPTLPLDQLSEKALFYVRRDRNEAIDILASRGIIPRDEVKLLKARPLGRLHIEEDA